MQVVAQRGISAQLPGGTEHLLEIGNWQSVQTARRHVRSGLAYYGAELRQARQSDDFSATLLEVLRDDRGDAGRGLAPTHIRLLLENPANAAAGEPGDERDQQNGDPAARDENAAPQLLRLYGHSRGV